MLQESVSDAAEAGEPAGRRIALRRLSLSDFRNYASLRLELGAEPVVLTGANGAGKTNLLEAISYLVPGRGLRGAPLERLCRLGQDRWAVAARVEWPEGEARVGTGFSQGDTGRSVRIDEETVRSTAALGELVRALWLTPSMDGLFTGPASDRRRFLDRLVLTADPAHASRVSEFEKAMRQRNRLLEARSHDRRWLDGIEAQMAAAATAVAAARRGVVAELCGLLEARRGGVFPDPLIELQGTLEDEIADRAAIEVEEAYAARLMAARGEDAAAGRTLEGPHRSDLAVTHAGHEMPASLCSTGEQKALLIALILAQARHVAAANGNTAPILLLDEVAAHLDDMRRAALFSEIRALGAQAFMTGTDRGLFTDIVDDAQCFEVARGGIAPA